MGLFLTLLYILTAYLTPLTLWGSLAAYHVEILIAAFAVLASVPSIQRSSLLSIPQTYALVGMCTAVVISGVLTGWLGSVPGAVLGFIPNAFTFFLVVVNCRTKGHLQMLIAVMMFICAFVVFQGYTALRADDLLNPYLMPQGDDIANRFYRLRGKGFINDPNDFSQVMVSLIPCLFFFTSKRGSILNYLLILPCVGWLIFGMYLTHSRGGMVALLAVMIFAFREKIGTIPAAGIAVAGFIGSSFTNFTGGRDVSMGEGAGRMEAWAAGLGLIKENPFFGVGFQRFSEYFPITAHNTVVVCAAELGMFGLFWWVMFVLPTIRDAAVSADFKAKKTPKFTDDFSYDRAVGARREPAVAELKWREPQKAVAADSSVGVLEAEALESDAVAIPAHLAYEKEDPKMDPEELRRISRLMLYSIVGYFVAGWFLSRAYIMTLFIYGGMVQVIYRMAMAQHLAPPRLRPGKVLKLSFGGAIGLVFVVYMMIRIQHLMGIR